MFPFAGCTNDYYTTSVAVIIGTQLCSPHPCPSCATRRPFMHKCIVAPCMYCRIGCTFASCLCSVAEVSLLRGSDERRSRRLTLMPHRRNQSRRASGPFLKIPYEAQHWDFCNVVFFIRRLCSVAEADCGQCMLKPLHY